MDASTDPTRFLHEIHNEGFENISMRDGTVGVYTEGIELLYDEKTTRSRFLRGVLEIHSRDRQIHNGVHLQRV